MLPNNQERIKANMNLALLIDNMQTNLSHRDIEDLLA